MNRYRGYTQSAPEMQGFCRVNEYALLTGLLRGILAKGQSGTGRISAGFLYCLLIWLHQSRGIELPEKSNTHRGE
jgi:hypothetical protein